MARDRRAFVASKVIEFRFWRLPWKCFVACTCQSEVKKQHLATVHEKIEVHITSSLFTMLGTFVKSLSDSPALLFAALRLSKEVVSRGIPQDYVAVYLGRVWVEDQSCRGLASPYCKLAVVQPFIGLIPRKRSLLMGLEPKPVLIDQGEDL